jgi:hypothetical protein
MAASPIFFKSWTFKKLIASQFFIFVAIKADVEMCLKNSLGADIALEAL